MDWEQTFLFLDLCDSHIHLCFQEMCASVINIVVIGGDGCQSFRRTTFSGLHIFRVSFYYLVF
jgi:hypothetical protein